MTDTKIRTINEEDLPFLDVETPEFADDPHAQIRAVREQGPLGRSRRGIEVFDHALAVEVLGDGRLETLGVEHFAKMDAPELMLSFVQDGLLLNMEKAHHDKIRRVLLRAFNIRRVDAERQVMRQSAEALLADVQDSGRFDFTEKFTSPYPARVLCLLLGIPVEDIHLFHQAAVDLHLMGAVPLAPNFPTIERSLLTTRDYVTDLLEARRRDPQDDFISALLEAQETEGLLSDDEIIWNIVNLLFAGQDTTRYQLASAVRAIVEADGWDTLADNLDLLPRALEESFRYYPVIQFLVRKPHVDVEVGGFTFPAGRRVIVNTMAASRDPKVFSDPDRLDITRDPLYRLPFGWGFHYCLGHALARSEMIEALTVLVTRLTNVRLVDGLELAPTIAMLGGPESMPIEFSLR